MSDPAYQTAGEDGAPRPAPRSRALGLAFRPAHDGDMAFMAELYASTRREELAPVPWPEETKRAFLQQQFGAQHTHYRTYFPEAAWLVVEHGGARVGRLYLGRWKDEHRVIDIALLPEWRGRGFGAAMMRDILDEAAAAGKAVRIHVEKNNPALHLYRRLGFQAVEDAGVYDLMEWTPGSRE